MSCDGHSSLQKRVQQTQLAFPPFACAHLAGSGCAALAAVCMHVLDDAVARVTGRRLAGLGWLMEWIGIIAGMLPPCLLSLASPEASP